VFHWAVGRRKSDGLSCHLDAGSSPGYLEGLGALDAKCVLSGLEEMLVKS